jgi:hypothetical protein
MIDQTAFPTMRSRLRSFAAVTAPCIDCSARRVRCVLKGRCRSSGAFYGQFGQVKVARDILPPRASISVSSRSINTTPARRTVHQLDYTCLTACCRELQQQWTPSKVESVIMAEESTLTLCLRTLSQSGWLHISWHQVAARVCMGMAPNRGEAAEAYPFCKLMNSRCVHHVQQYLVKPAPN